MKQSDKKPEKDKYGVTDTDDLAACSAMDCTGLIPAGPVTEEERERYEEIYPSLTPPVLLHNDEEKKKISPGRM